MAENKLKNYPQLNNKTLRYALQQIGTEQFKHLNPATWINYLDRRILCYEKLMLSKNNSIKAFVIDDLRFPDELAYLKKKEATIIYISNIIADRKWQYNTSFSTRFRRFINREGTLRIHDSEAHYQQLAKESDYYFKNKMNRYTKMNFLELIHSILNKTIN